MEKKFTLLALTFISAFSVLAQDYSMSWQGHFSFLDVRDIIETDDQIYAASENAVFSYDINTKEIAEITTVNGLSGEEISSIHYSDGHQLLIIGYENGLIEVLDEATQEVLSVVDILDKQTIPSEKKRINHFEEHDGLLYISTGFGITVYNLSNLEFDDTYYIGTGGNQIEVNQSTIFGEYIYAACGEGEGIKRGLISNDNLIDYQEWEQVTSGIYYGIETVADRLYCLSSNRNLYEIIGVSLNQLQSYASQPVDFKSVNNNLIVTIPNEVFVYDSNFQLIISASVVPDFDTNFTSATATDEGIYIGTKDFGVLRTEKSNITKFEEIHPEGPLMNNTFSVESGFAQVWASYGDYSLNLNPHPIKTYGISRLFNNVWENTPYDNLLGATSLNDITINPTNPNQVFVSSFHRGILEMEGGDPKIRHDELNSGLETLIIPNSSYVSIRVSGKEFDNNGLLWSITSLIDKPLKSYNPQSNQWISYDFTELIAAPGDNIGFEELAIHPSGIKFIASFSYGVIGYDSNRTLIKSLSEDNGLPDKVTRAVALDNRNQLWIGTDKGLRVLYNTGNFFEDDNLVAEPVIILDNGIARELLEEQFITDIKVDGSNNKWIATIGAGLYYISSDGQQIISHFTKDNSPLPSNNVNDVSIDGNNGVVYIATDRGLISYRSGGSSPTEELVEAYVYPNPVRPGYDIMSNKVKIKDITENVNIKITDIEGNLVAEAQSRTNQRHRGFNLEIDGGTAFWNGRNMANNKVASGVYLVMISDLDSLETKVLKLMIVR
jgi:hypothetical protein